MCLNMVLIMFNHLLKFIRGLRLGCLFFILALFGCCGCGDFFAEKPTELQSQSILQDLGEIRRVPDLDTPLPDIYLGEPKIIEGKDDAKLFYFTKHHTVDKLSGLVEEQLGYTVSQSPATNQLIVKCPTVDEARATIGFLRQVDVPPIQIKIDCLISEVYADKTLDWATSIEISDFLGEDITLGGSAGLFGKNVSELVKEGAILPAFPGASLREVGRAKMGLKVGYLSESHEFLAMVDMLESKGYLKILMHPTLEVINGKTAKISTSEHVPLPKEVLGSEGVYPYMITEYKDVIDSLEITPYAFADGSIGLETKAVISSKNIPEGVKQIPILSRREIAIEENRIRPGESLVVGGIRKSEEYSVVRGVPFLKDIPLLGILFSSKDYGERAKEVIFIITPSISSGGIPSEEMMERVRKRHAAPEYEAGLDEALTDLLGTTASTGGVEQQGAQAESERLKARIEQAKSLEEANQIEERLLERDEQVLAEKAKVAEGQSKALRAKKQAEQAKAATDKVKAEIEQSTAEAEKAKVEAKKANVDAEKAEAEGQKGQS